VKEALALPVSRLRVRPAARVILPAVLTRIDHIGIVVPSWEEGRRLLLSQFGFVVNEARTRMPEGNYYLPGNSRIYFVSVGRGETDIEVLVPLDDKSGIGRFLARRGPGLHHICYASDSLSEDVAVLRQRGLEQIPAGSGDVNPESAPFFYPRSALGVLTEIVRERR
jgi:methylmalonyl-CoA/ethylmalonyl-CoA epimerase